MATNVGTIELIATIDTGKYKRGAKDIDAANKDIQESTEEATSRGESAWKKYSSMAATYAKVGAAAVGAAFALAVKSVANLEQSLGGSEVVFGKFAKTVQDTAVRSFAIMGTSTNQYLETANKMGSLFQGAGFDIQHSMELTMETMQRATDVATAMGISSESALESIAGAAKGNFTMMDNLGVAMNDTTLNAYALEKGIGKTTQQMTNAEKIGLAMEMFLERTAKFAGNYARENETLSGSFQTLRGAFTNFMGGIEGSDKQLADSIINMGRVLANTLPGIATNLAKGVQGLFTNLLSNIELGDTDPTSLGKQVAAVLNAAVKYVSIGTDAIKEWFGKINWGDLGLTIGRQAVAFVIGFVIGLLDFDIEAAFKVLADNWLPAVIGLLSLLFAPAKLARPIGMLLSKLPFGNLLMRFILRPIRNLFAPIREGFGVAFGKIGDVVLAPFRNAGGAIGGILTNIGRSITGFIDDIGIRISYFPEFVAGIFRTVISTIGSLLNAGLGIVRTIFSGIWSAITTILRPLTTFFGNLFRAIWGQISGIFSGTGAFFSRIFTGALNIVRNIWNAASGFFSGVWNRIASVFNGVIGFFSRIFNGAINGVKNIWNGFVGWIQHFWNRVVGMFGNAGTRVGDAIGGAFKWAINSVLRGAINIINGFINSINNIIGVVNNIPGVNIGRIGQLAVPQLASGGIVTSPTLAMIGEGREDEAVIPLSKLDQMLGNSGNTENNSNITIQIQGVFATSAVEQRRVAQQIADKLQEIQQAKGMKGNLDVRY